MISLLLTLILIGLLLYLVETLIPLDPTIRQIIRVVVVVCVILWLLGLFGVLDRFDVPVPRVR